MNHGWTRRRWTKVLFKVAGAQAAVQAVQLATGFWIIRATSKADYAWYTIAYTLFSAILILADSGVTSSLMAAGGREWQNTGRLGQLLYSALAIRRRLTAVIAVIIIPLLMALLMRNTAPFWRAAVLGLIVGATVSGELTNHTYMVVFRLRTQFAFTQRIALLGALGRIFWLTLFVFGRLRAEVAFLAASVNTAIQFIFLRRKIGDHADPGAERDPALETQAKGVISKQLWLNMYYCLQGQIGIWLASAFGGTNQVSDLGAMSRLGALFVVSMSVMNEVVFPGFAKTQSADAVQKSYFRIATGYTAFLVIVVLVVSLLRHPILYLFGRQYQHLQTELVLAVIYAAINGLTQVLWGLNYSRAWIVSPVPYIAATTCLQAALAFAIPVSTVTGILWFSIASLAPSVLFPIVLSLKQMRLLDREYVEVLREAQGA